MSQEDTRGLSPISMKDYEGQPLLTPEQEEIYTQEPSCTIKKREEKRQDESSDLDEGNIAKPLKKRSFSDLERVKNSGAQDEKQDQECLVVYDRNKQVEKNKDAMERESLAVPGCSLNRGQCVCQCTGCLDFKKKSMESMLTNAYLPVYLQRMGYWISPGNRYSLLHIAKHDCGLAICTHKRLSYNDNLMGKKKVIVWDTNNDFDELVIVFEDPSCEVYYNFDVNPPDAVLGWALAREEACL